MISHTMDRYLQDIGFSGGEEKVYIALLRLGTSTTGKIAKEANVSRSKLYEILEKLSKKGVVAHFKKNNVSHFTASHPSNIVDYIRKREKELQDKELEFQKHLPFLENIFERKTFLQEAEVFEGMEGIKIVREQALNDMKKGETMYYFGNDATSHSNVLGYWDDWNSRRVKKGINANIIYNQDASFYGERRKKLKFTKVRYLREKGTSHAWIEIYGDIVAIALKHETPMSVVIRNKHVADSFKTYFEILWSVGIDTVK